MQPKPQLDLFGVVGLSGMALLLAFNQVVIKVTNGGFQPVFFAGLRSFGAIFCIWVLLRLRGTKVDLKIATHWQLGLLIGAVFAFEFMFLFFALDLTTVARSSVIFYSMPVWMTLGAHFLLPSDTLTGRKTLGLGLAVAGVAVAMADRQGGEASLLGDTLALVAAVLWAAIGLLAKGSRLKELRPESQLMWQVLVSAPILLIMAPLFGPLIRDVAAIHIAGLAFQIVVVITLGFIFWLWLLSIYPASAVASFSFLSPVFGVALGWLLLKEPVGLMLIVALALVAAGIVLINLPAKAAPKHLSSQ